MGGPLVSVKEKASGYLRKAGDRLFIFRTLPAPYSLPNILIFLSNLCSNLWSQKLTSNTMPPSHPRHLRNPVCELPSLKSKDFLKGSLKYLSSKADLKGSSNFCLQILSSRSPLKSLQQQKEKVLGRLDRKQFGPDGSGPSQSKPFAVPTESGVGRPD